MILEYTPTGETDKRMAAARIETNSPSPPRIIIVRTGVTLDLKAWRERACRVIKADPKEKKLLVCWDFCEKGEMNYDHAH